MLFHLESNMYIQLQTDLRDHSKCPVLNSTENLCNVISFMAFTANGVVKIWWRTCQEAGRL